MLAPGPIRPARVMLRVADVERSATFYAELVGLEPDGIGPDTGTLRAPGGEVLVELRRAADPALYPPEHATGLFHSAFLYPTRADLGAALRRAAAARIPLTGASDHLVSEALYVRDPDGHGIELYRDRPAAEWPPAPPGARVAMDTLPLDLGSLLDEDEIDARPDEIALGHVHLRVADTAAAVAFWTDEVGLELMATFGPQAAFLASGNYHHHIGANTWSSAGAGPEPAAGPGLDAVVLHAPRAAELISPDGVRVVLEP